MKVLKLACKLVLTCALAVSAVTAQAQIVTLIDGTSTAQIDAGSQAGMFNWFVNSHDYLAQQWFWYRIGDTGPESALNTLSAPSVLQPVANQVSLSYANAGLSVEADYLLSGQTAGAKMNETITINNTTTNSLPLHFFQYANFDLGSADTVQLGLSGGKFNYALQTSGSLLLSETVVTPGANHGEAALFPVTLNKLYDALPTTLSDAAGPVGPGDVTWAFQWDLDIPAGSSVIISKIKTLEVPEPAALSLLVLSLGALALRRRT